MEKSSLTIRKHEEGMKIYSIGRTDYLSWKVCFEKFITVSRLTHIRFYKRDFVDYDDLRGIISQALHSALK